MDDDLPNPIEFTAGHRLLVISPHLDDAVFACGRLLATVPGAVVATLFAGRPPEGGGLAEWDRAAGFREGEDIIGARREEDRRALELLDAWPLWLDLVDAQYGQSPSLAEVVAQMRLLLMQCLPETVLFPLGLFHSDHLLCHEAALVLMDRCSGCRWYAYEDALYRRLPSLLDEKVDALRRAGRSPRPFHLAEAPDAAARKRRAVACYRSQLKALATPGRPGHEDLAAEEGYWQVQTAAIRDAL